MNSEYIKDLNVRPKLIKLLEENIEQKLNIIGYGSEFLHVMSKAQVTTTKKANWTS